MNFKLSRSIFSVLKKVKISFKKPIQNVNSPLFKALYPFQTQTTNIYTANDLAYSC